MYKKKALILAVGAALAIPCAYAQKGGGRDKGEEPDSVVELYGKVYPEVIREYGKGATAAGDTVATFAAAPTGTNNVITRNEVESSNSRFGIRGSERLGGGWRATFQLETQFLLDQNTTAFAARDSWIGLNHNVFGTVKLGRFDTPFKEYGDDISFLGISSGNFVSTSALYRRFGFGTSSTARFHERATNALQYESNDIHGLDFKAMYSTLETDTLARHPHFVSFGAKYQMGNLAILVGHEEHFDLFGGSNNVPTAMRNLGDANARSKDKASAIAFTYKLGRHSFELDYNWKEWKEFGMNPTAAGRFDSYKNNGMILLWDARWNDQWRTQVHWVRSTKGTCTRTLGASCNTDGLEGNQFSYGFAYYFSKRTYLFVMGQTLKNGKSAMFASGIQTPSDGEDVTQYAIGMNTTF
jgi:predicted porin